jgi:monoamine oxidase
MTEETLRVVGDGLDGRPGARKRIVVLGAGLAGLVAAYELKHQGHEIIVLEAQNRVGGRVLTCRECAPGLYAEFGAMWIPRSHDLTLKYCSKFNLALTPFVMGNPKGLVHICGQRMTLEDAQRSPERLPFDLAPHERGKTADQLWTAAIADIKALVDRDGPSAWGADPCRVRPVLALRVPQAPELLPQHLHDGVVHVGLDEVHHGVILDGASTTACARCRFRAFVPSSSADRSRARRCAPSAS